MQHQVETTLQSVIEQNVSTFVTTSGREKKWSSFQVKNLAGWNSSSYFLNIRSDKQWKTINKFLQRLVRIAGKPSD